MHKTSRGNPRAFHGTKKNGPYFEGWYLKHQAESGTSLALIPALHMDAAGQASTSLQVVTEGKSWWLEYPAAGFDAAETEFRLRLGRNLFTRDGIQLDIQREGLALHGVLRYGPFRPLRSDIMGPFRFLPGMECSHGVISMSHALEGSLCLNGQSLDFSGGRGYIETDRGRSFPSAYLWTQCDWLGPEQGSLMLSVASIPLAAGHFTGCICAVLLGGREYRLASYRGARVEHWDARGAVLRQGKYRLEAALLAEQGCSLRAPIRGSMARPIRESLRARVCYRFWEGERLLLDRTDSGASFEYAD